MQDANHLPIPVHDNHHHPHHQHHHANRKRSESDFDDIKSESQFNADFENEIPTYKKAMKQQYEAALNNYF